MLIEVKIFWAENQKASEQEIMLAQVPRPGELVKTKSGYLGSVASVQWLLDGDPIVHIVLT